MFRCPECGKKVETFGVGWGYISNDNKKCCSYKCLRLRNLKVRPKKDWIVSKSRVLKSGDSYAEVDKIVLRTAESYRAKGSPNLMI